MTAIDTNILVRIFVRDSEVQAARALEFVRSQDRLFVAKTVLLEVEWVLRRGYQFPRGEILALLREFLDTPNVNVEDEAAVLQALFCYERGMDFADSLHLASAGPQISFATFDRALQRAATRLGVAKIIAM